MNIISEIRKRLYGGIQDVPSDDLSSWIDDHQPTTEVLERELVRSNGFQREADKSFQDVKAARQSKLEDMVADGNRPGSYDVVDPLSPEFVKLFGGLKAIAQNQFGVRPDSQGLTRSLKTELKERMNILLRHLGLRHRAEKPAYVGEAVVRIRELKLSVLDLHASTRDLFPRAQIDPAKFGSEYAKVKTELDNARRSIDSTKADVRARGFEGALS